MSAAMAEDRSARTHVTGFVAKISSLGRTGTGLGALSLVRVYAEGLMKTKPTWKPIGHSAKKWRETARRKGSSGVLPAFPPQREKAARQKGEVK